jgi:hypothetical protein
MRMCEPDAQLLERGCVCSNPSEKKGSKLEVCVGSKSLIRFSGRSTHQTSIRLGRNPG